MSDLDTFIARVPLRPRSVMVRQNSDSKLLDPQMKRQRSSSELICDDESQQPSIVGEQKTTVDLRVLLNTNRGMLLCLHLDQVEIYSLNIHSP